LTEKLDSRETEYFSESQKQAIQEECRKLDVFQELLLSGKDLVAAERNAFKMDGRFYREFEKLKVIWKRQDDTQLRKIEREKKLEMNRRAERRAILNAQKVFDSSGFPEEDIYEERRLSKQQKDKLLAVDFQRLKISPFGDSGAAWFWVKKRHNESKEHAFFCYFIRRELQKYVEDVRINTTSGPDVTFEYDDSKYSFDIETGSNLKRNPEYVKKKFDWYKKHYDYVYVFVTTKDLKYSYPQFAQVVTRGTLKSTITGIFG